MTTILDIVRDIDTLDPDLTIYARSPWTCESEAILAVEPEDGKTDPPEAVSKGVNYFIEVDIAKEFLDDWQNSVDRKIPLLERCERLVYYAEHDC